MIASRSHDVLREGDGWPACTCSQTLGGWRVIESSVRELADAVIPDVSPVAVTCRVAPGALRKDIPACLEIAVFIGNDVPRLERCWWARSSTAIMLTVSPG